jgi:hypothetical protein
MVVQKNTKILCVCEKGNVRSVGIARRLKDGRHYTNVIAIGAVNTERPTLFMLCEWAEIILIAEPQFADLLPVGHEKIADFTIGPDIYRTPTNNRLQNLVGHQLNKIGLR